jgi:hypothetical protein
MGELLLACSFIIFIMLIIFVKKQKQVRQAYPYDPRRSLYNQTSANKRISRFSRDDSSIKKYSPRTREKYYSVDSPRDTLTDRIGNPKPIDKASSYNYNIMNFYTPCILTDTKDGQKVGNATSEFTCSALKPEQLNQLIPKPRASTVSNPGAGTHIPNIPSQPNQSSHPNHYSQTYPQSSTNLVYNVMRLSDFIREEKVVDRAVIDLDDVTTSLSKFHSFDNCAKTVLENKLNNISIKTPEVKEEDLLNKIIPKKIDFSSIKKDNNQNESFTTFHMATENKENINKN